MTEDYCSAEVSLLLRDNGFNEPCRVYYERDFDDEDLWYLHEYIDDDFKSNDKRREDEVNAPTLQMAMKWLYEKYKIFIQITPTIGENGDEVFVAAIYNYGMYHDRVGKNSVYSTIQTAIEISLIYVLENYVIIKFNNKW